MKKSTYRVPGTPCPSFLRYNRSLLLLTWIFVGLGISSYCQAQSTHSVDFKQLDMVVSVPNVTLMQGQSTTVTVAVGNADHTVLNALGYTVSVELDEDASWTASLNPSLSGSWMATSSQSVAETHDAASPSAYAFTFQRTSAVSGAGMVLQLTLTANEDNVLASKLLKTVGGVMQIDNLDLRLAAPAIAQPEMQVWPNPSDGLIQLQCKGLEVQTTKIFSLQGQLIASHGPVDALDLHEFQSGTYFLEVADNKGHALRQKLVLY